MACFELTRWGYARWKFKRKLEPLRKVVTGPWSLSARATRKRQLKEQRVAISLAARGGLTWHSARPLGPDVVKEVVGGVACRREGEPDMATAGEDQDEDG